MESMETADIVEIALIQREAIGAQLQFWLSATFAVIVASFVAGSRLTSRHRFYIGLLYLLATAMTFAGWAESGSEIVRWYAELESRGILFDAPMFTVVLRVLLMTVGTVLTITFLYQNRELNDDDGEQ
ncbi:Uncharacterised protein [Halioglobus japonicus]|nr:Uncharacterised protein [Halioglobus japonicus]